MAVLAVIALVRYEERPRTERAFRDRSDSLNKSGDLQFPKKIMIELTHLIILLNTTSTDEHQGITHFQCTFIYLIIYLPYLNHILNRLNQ